ncbi:MAG: hypothetical protein IPP81_12760 [Chitinophagaceae bacterium]|nr:hypothetical protein [Chitinophagaceae bacterium]
MGITDSVPISPSAPPDVTVVTPVPSILIHASSVKLVVFKTGAAPKVT